MKGCNGKIFDSCGLGQLCGKRHYRCAGQLWGELLSRAVRGVMCVHKAGLEVLLTVPVSAATLGPAWVKLCSQNEALPEGKDELRCWDLVEIHMLRSWGCFLTCTSPQVSLTNTPKWERKVSRSLQWNKRQPYGSQQQGMSWQWSLNLGGCQNKVAKTMLPHILIYPLSCLQY